MLMFDLFCLVLFDLNHVIQPLLSCAAEEPYHLGGAQAHKVERLRRYVRCWGAYIRSNRFLVIPHPGRFMADYHIIIIAFLHICCAVSLDSGGQCHVPRQYLDLWKKRQRKGTIIHMMNANENS